MEANENILLSGKKLCIILAYIQIGKSANGTRNLYEQDLKDL